MRRRLSGMWVHLCARRWARCWGDTRGMETVSVFKGSQGSGKGRDPNTISVSRTGDVVESWSAHEGRGLPALGWREEGAASWSNGD